MKKVITIVLLFCLILTFLAACSTNNKLSGTYKSKGIIAQTFTFSGDNNVTMSAFGINASGTYKLDEDAMSITYNLLGMEYTWNCKFEKSGSSIFIEGTEFVKE